MTDKTSGPAVSGSTAPARAAETAAPDFQDLVAPVPDAVRKESVAVGVSRAPSAGARWAAEFAGTTVLVFAGVGTGIFATQVIDSALGFGLGLLAVLVAFGHVSGGHFNPAVTLAAVVSGRTPAKVALGYVVAQVLGALVAVGNGYGENSTSQAGWPTVLLIEFVATTLFVLVVLGSTAPRANAVLAPVAIGATFAFLLTILAPFDGGSLNPARSTGTAVIGGAESLSQLWLFWVAPLLGGLVAGLIYRVVDLGRAPRPATVPPAEDATASTGTDTSSAPTA